MSAAPPNKRPLGLIAMGVAVLCFSLGSTLVKKADIPGPALAFWRMVLTSTLWSAIVWFTEHGTVTRADLRRALVPGMVFGLNITLFFTGVGRTSVANAEFIGALSPLVIVPAGAILFHEHLNSRALWFGLVSVCGLMLVVFNGPARGAATWQGNLIVVAAMLLWSTYLITSRRLRAHMSVQRIMASMMIVATVTILPIVVLRGELLSVTTQSLPYLLILAVLTGTLAHGLIVFAQHTVPIGTIGILQVAQPALAVGWAYLLLGQEIRAVQLVGMALVITGLVAVVVVSRRGIAARALAEQPFTAAGDR